MQSAAAGSHGTAWRFNGVYELRQELLSSLRIFVLICRDFRRTDRTILLTRTKIVSGFEENRSFSAGNKKIKNSNGILFADVCSLCRAVCFAALNCTSDQQAQMFFFYFPRIGLSFVLFSYNNSKLSAAGEP